MLDEGWCFRGKIGFTASRLASRFHAKNFRDFFAQNTTHLHQRESTTDFLAIL
jgi:hypothetical protein